MLFYSPFPSKIVSIHAPWEGCDPASTIRAMVDYCFNSRTLGRVRLNSEHRTNATSSFNSRTLGRVRRGRPGGVLLAQKVSIHAPWAGCDTFFPVSSLMLCCFNSRTLGRVRLFHQRTPKTAALCFNSRTLGRVRLGQIRVLISSMKFQFTHPGKGATAGKGLGSTELGVSIHAPWEGCDAPRYAEYKTANEVSIHAPWEGCDLQGALRYCAKKWVSIHAPWEGCDHIQIICTPQI